MKHSKFTWKTDDGLQIFAQCWEPKTKIHAVVCLVHGLGEHSDRYTDVASALTNAGYAVLGFDLRGHGRSGGQRGHTPSYGMLLDDITHLLTESSSRFPNKPCFLYGHSMGGNLVLNYALLRRTILPAGIIATAPYLGMAYQVPVWKIILAKIMNEIWPSLPQKTGLDSTALSRNLKIVEAYKKDPFVHDRISVHMFISIRKAAQWALANADKFSLPLLLMHGKEDRLTSAQASEDFARRVKCDSTFKIWEGLFHEIHNEPQQKEVFNFIIAWLERHTIH